MKKNAIVVGSSDGIGLALTKKLLRLDWKVIGLSRSKSRIIEDCYEHHVVEVQHADYPITLESVLDRTERVDLCLYCPGIGELLEIENMQKEIKVFKVNLLGLVQTAICVLPKMVQQGEGHLIGLSSVADEMLSSEGPSYHASKAGFSNYLESLGLALKSTGVTVTNLRFGFVDTKMAHGDKMPFMISPDEAADHILRCVQKKPIRYTAPRIIIPLVKFRKWMQRLNL